MKRYEPFGMYEMVESEEGATYGGYVDADIAQELYDHLKHAVDQARAVIYGEEPEGDDEDFENWFLSACKLLEKADKD